MKQWTIVVIGGGVAGWSVACALGRVFGAVGVKIIFIDNEKIDFVQAEQAGTYIHDFNAILGIPLFDLITKTQSTFSYGVRIKDWSFSSQDILLDESAYSSLKLDESLIDQYLILKQNGLQINIDDLSVVATTARAGRFSFPDNAKTSIFSELQFGLNLDLPGYTHLISQTALSSGVNHIKAQVTGCTKSQTNEVLQAVVLNSGQEVFADLFIDCSCDGDLVSKVLNVQEFSIPGIPEQPWTASGMVDPDVQFFPFAEWQGLGYGVANVFPLQEKTVLAMYAPQEKNIASFSGVLSSNCKYESLYKKTNSCLSEFWRGNVLAMGKAAYSLPITPWGEFKWLRNQLVCFVELFGGFSSIEYCAKEYNRRMIEEYQSVLELVVLTYYVGAGGNKFYNEFFRDTPLMDEVQHRLQLFLDNARPPLTNHQVINNDQLRVFLIGSNIFPILNKANFTAESRRDIEGLVQKRFSMCHAAAQKIPLYSEFMQRYLRSK